MSKRFSIIDNEGIIENLVIASEEYGHSMGWIFIEGYNVTVGDRYENGKFYDREGNEIEKEKSELESNIDNLNLNMELVEGTIMELTTVIAQLQGGTI